MKTALVTTTINVPRILELLRRYDSEVRFFIAGDRKSPDTEMLEWMENMPNTVWLSTDAQCDLGYKCNHQLGWNTTARRNIATLEAIKWGAEIIVYWDDDNLPMNSQYFWSFQGLIDHKWPFDGLQASSHNRWCNQYGSVIKHRGFPTEIHVQPPVFSHIVEAKVGVAAGLCLGNPDIDAYTRMTLGPKVDMVNELAREGCVVAHNTHCVFNSQNTAFLRKFAPTMFLAPGIGRADDIFASLLTQRAMREQGYHVHIGPPFTYQERNPHDLLVDLRNEIFCMENVLELSEFIDRMPREASPMAFARAYYSGCAILPEETRCSGLAFLDDLEKVL
jgi:hypothetical protein